MNVLLHLSAANGGVLDQIWIVFVTIIIQKSSNINIIGNKEYMQR